MIKVFAKIFKCQVFLIALAKIKVNIFFVK